jgi:hypothetical protein
MNDVFGKTSHRMPVRANGPSRCQRGATPHEISPTNLHPPTAHPRGWATIEEVQWNDASAVEWIGPSALVPFPIRYLGRCPRLR